MASTRITRLPVGTSPKTPSTRLNRTARKRRKLRNSLCEATEDYSTRSRRNKTPKFRMRKHRVRGEQTKFREKVRPKGYNDYTLEVHLNKEWVDFVGKTNHSNILNTTKTKSCWKTHSRNPGRRRYSYMKTGIEYRGEHENIIEHMQIMMPVRALRHRNDREQKTRLYLKSDSDFMILKTLYGEQICKVYRLIDEASA